MLPPAKHAVNSILGACESRWRATRMPKETWGGGPERMSSNGTDPPTFIVVGRHIALARDVLTIAYQTFRLSCAGASPPFKWRRFITTARKKT